MTSTSEPETVTSITAKTFNPGKAASTMFAQEAQGLKSSSRIDNEYEQADLDKVAARGKFPSRPSDLFLKMFAAAVDAADRDPKTAVCSPSLLGTSGVVTLTIISTIPDIMQHYHDVICTAQKEVLIATNAWESGRSVDLVTSAFQILNDRAAKDGRKVVVKVLMDAANIRNLFQSRYDRKPSTWHKIGIPHDKLENIDLDLVNYHVAPLGTFHSKFAVIDRQIALVNSNNINIRSNVEMMCQFEGDVVNSLYDAFLISWGKEIPNPPGLPCINNPAAANREFFFGQRQAYVDHKSKDQGQQASSDSASSVHDRVDTEVAGVNKQMESTHISKDPESSKKHESKKEKKADEDNKSAERREQMETDDYTHSAQHASDPAHAILNESRRYDKENHASTASMTINERLNSEEDAEQTEFEFESDFAPFYLHSPHEPVPMALVNRQPQALPGHHDVHNPQNAAWLQALKLAKKEVFIQSPVFNASPIVQAVLDACKRGVTVTLYVGLGFNDFAEGVVPFQGGTNDDVRKRMQEELVKEEKQKFLRWHWYVAKDQNAPLRFEKQARNCHVKFLQVDRQVAIMGSGNMDTQSWFHSQEVNVMVDSEFIVNEWLENFAANQNTGKYGLTDEHGNLVSGKPIPEKKGIGGLSRAQGGFL